MILLQTNRTILRAFDDKDLANLEELMTDPEVMKFTGLRSVQPLGKIEECLSNWVKEGCGSLGVFCVEEKETKEFVGWFMLKDTGFHNPELGFMLVRNKWGQGLATEVAKEFIQYAKNQLHFEKVIARTVSENVASISVLKKIGMVPSDIDFPDPNYEILSFEIDLLTLRL